MTDYALTEEKLSLAVYDLARGFGTRRLRLLEVWTTRLAGLTEACFPDHLQSAFRRLRDQLEESFELMSDDFALQAIDAILDLHTRMEW